MALQDFFVWGSGGAKKTPDQIARDREVANALLGQGVDTSPVGHWLQGLARVANAGAGAFGNWQLDRQEQEGRDAFQQRWDSAFGGGDPTQVASINPVAAALASTGSDAVSLPGGDQAGMIRQGLIDRGLPEHVADAFMLNFQDESGLNPGINEASPLVPGSRGGYGLAQWTGDRRNALEQFAAGRNSNVADPNVQLDFLMQELQGPEAKAYQAIMSAPDTNQAAAAIVNQFLRPAEANRARREAAYLGGSAPTRVAQANRPDMAALLGLASDPYANDAQRQIINALVGQQIKQSDPAYQMGLEKSALELDALRNPPAAKPDYGFAFGPDGSLIRTDKTTGTFERMGEFGKPDDGLTDTQRNLSWRAQEAGLVPGTPEYAEFMRSGGQSTGMALTVGPDGTIQFAQGAGVTGKPLTEAQSKDAVFATRAGGSLPILDQFGSALTDPVQRAMEADPTGVIRGKQSPEFQQAQQAGLEFLQAILRKDTGAAITPAETAEYGKVYLPMPGDTPEVLERKKASRSRALEALKAGMAPQAILNMENALGMSPATPQPSQSTANPDVVDFSDYFR